MNKLFTKIAGLTIGLAMAIGVGIGLGSGVKEAKAAAGDEITSVNNIVSGKAYFIKGIQASKTTGNAKYLSFTDSAGESVAGTGVDSTANAVPLTFTYTSSKWYITTPTGLYLTLHASSNGRLVLQKAAVNVTITNSTFNSSSQTTGYLAIVGNSRYLHKNSSAANFGSYAEGTGNNVTLIEASDEVSLTYNANGADSGNVPVDNNSPYTRGDSVSVLGNTGGLSKSGYYFRCWNTAANGTGTNYNPGDSFSISSATILYAMWQSPNSITFSQYGLTNAADYTGPASTSLFSVSFSKSSGGTHPKYYNDGYAVRAYAMNTITVTAANSAKIGKITIGFGSSDGSNEITSNIGNYSAGVWTGSSNEVVFTIGGNSGQRRIASVTIVLASEMTISAAGDATSVEVGGTLQLSLSPSSANAVTWVSSDETKATVSANGLVTGVATTNAVTITAKRAEYLDAQIVLEVTAASGAFVTFVQTDFTNNCFTGDEFEIDVTYGNLGTDSIIFTASIANKISFQFNDNEDGTGTITGTMDAVCSGLTLTASINEKNYATATFTVAQSQINSFTIEETAITIGTSENKLLTFTLNGQGNYNHTITWTSSDINIATVSNGTVVGVATGTATITGEAADGKNDTVEVTVIRFGTTTTPTSASSLGLNNEDSVPSFDLYSDENDDAISASFAKGTHDTLVPKYFTNDTTIRIYSGNTMTIESTKSNIQKITFVGTVILSANVGVFNGKVWVSNSPVDEVIFTGTGTSKITSVSVTYFDATTFSADFMHMTDYDPDLETKGTDNGNGDCATYYPLAKTAFGKLFDKDRETFCTLGSYEDAAERLEAWASANGDRIDANYNLVSKTRVALAVISQNETTATIIVAISLVSICALGAFLTIKRKKEN